MKSATLAAPSSPLPAGFDQHNTGLIVPHELARKRRVFTAEQHKKLTSAVHHALAPNNIRFALMCNDPRCADPIKRRVRTADGGFILRCACTDLVYSPHV